MGAPSRPKSISAPCSPIRNKRAGRSDVSQRFGGGCPTEKGCRPPCSSHPRAHLLRKLQAEAVGHPLHRSRSPPCRAFERRIRLTGHIRRAVKTVNRAICPVSHGEKFRPGKPNAQTDDSFGALWPEEEGRAQRFGGGRPTEKGCCPPCSSQPRAHAHLRRSRTRYAGRL